MEKNIELFEHGEHININEYSPLTLAFLGDAVYELFIRSNLTKDTNTSPNNLHKRAIQYVKASAQCEAYDRIEPVLTDDELRIFKRGRNTKVNTKAKNAALAEYKKATGFETLLGYLYIKADNKRLYELLNIATNFDSN